MQPLSLVNPLPQQALMLYELRKSKFEIIASTSTEINKLCLIINYLKNMDQRNELLDDKKEGETLYENAIKKLKQQNIETTKLKQNLKNENENKKIFHKSNKQLEINKIINSYRRKDTFNGDIETEINQTIQSKLLFINEITKHIYKLREEIKYLTHKIKSKTFECSICFEVLHSKHLYTISKCKHQLCILCIHKHIVSSMERKREQPKCPFINCEQELLHYDDLKNILSDSEYSDINYKLNMNEISKLETGISIEIDDQTIEIQQNAELQPQRALYGYNHNSWSKYITDTSNYLRHTNLQKLASHTSTTLKMEHEEIIRMLVSGYIHCFEASDNFKCIPEDIMFIINKFYYVKISLSQTDKQCLRYAFDFAFGSIANPRDNVEVVIQILMTIGITDWISLDDITDCMQGTDDGKWDLFSLAEFVVLLEEKLEWNEMKDGMKDQFKLFDKNGDGVIDFEDLKEALSDLGEEVQDKDIKEMIKQADFYWPKKSVVGFEEFCIKAQRNHFVGGDGLTEITYCY